MIFPFPPLLLLPMITIQQQQRRRRRAPVRPRPIAPCRRRRHFLGNRQRHKQLHKQQQQQQQQVALTVYRTFHQAAVVR